jgi:hypothetical protein
MPEHALDRTAQIVQGADDRTLCFAKWGDPVGRPVFSLHGTLVTYAALGHRAERDARPDWHRLYAWLSVSG